MWESMSPPFFETLSIYVDRVFLVIFGKNIKCLIMRWSYLVGHILTTFILSPFVAFLLKIISNILESGEINSFSGTDINQVVGVGTMLGALSIFGFFIYFYIAAISSIIPIIIYIAVFFVLKLLKFDFIIAKGLLITINVVIVTITFYVTNKDTIINNLLIQSYCGVALISGIFFKLKRF